MGDLKDKLDEEFKQRMAKRKLEEDRPPRNSQRDFGNSIFSGPGARRWNPNTGMSPNGMAPDC